MEQNNSKDKILVVGEGARGVQYAKILKTFGCQVGFVGGQSLPATLQGCKHFKALTDGFQVFQPTTTIIASDDLNLGDIAAPLTQHNYSGRLLLVGSQHAQLTERIASASQQWVVGFHLRFHPLIGRLREELKGKKIIDAHLHLSASPESLKAANTNFSRIAGTFPERSATLFALYDELDVFNFIFDNPVISNSIHSLPAGAKSFASYHVLATTSLGAPISLFISANDYTSRRELLIRTDQKTLRVDLVSQFIQFGDAIENFDMPHDDVMRRQVKALLEERYEHFGAWNYVPDLLRCMKEIDREPGAAPLPEKVKVQVVDPVAASPEPAKKSGLEEVPILVLGGSEQLAMALVNGIRQSSAPCVWSLTEQKDIDSLQSISERGISFFRANPNRRDDLKTLLTLCVETSRTPRIVLNLLAISTAAHQPSYITNNQPAFDRLYPALNAALLLRNGMDEDAKFELQLINVLPSLGETLSSASAKRFSKLDNSINAGLRAWFMEELTGRGCPVRAHWITHDLNTAKDPNKIAETYMWILKTAVSDALEGTRGMEIIL